MTGEFNQWQENYSGLAMYRRKNRNLLSWNIKGLGSQAWRSPRARSTGRRGEAMGEAAGDKKSYPSLFPPNSPKKFTPCY